MKVAHKPWWHSLTAMSQVLAFPSDPNDAVFKAERKRKINRDIRDMLNSGADPNAVDEVGRTALEFMVNHTDFAKDMSYEVVFDLLRAGANPFLGEGAIFNPDKGNAGKRTGLLAIASKMAFNENLDRGVVRSEIGENVLHFLCRYDPIIARRALELKEDKNAKTFLHWVNEQDEDGNTPSHYLWNAFGVLEAADKALMEDGRLTSNEEAIDKWFVTFKGLLAAQAQLFADKADLTLRNRDGVCALDLLNRRMPAPCDEQQSLNQAMGPALLAELECYRMAKDTPATRVAMAKPGRL